MVKSISSLVSAAGQQRSVPRVQSTWTRRRVATALTADQYRPTVSAGCSFAAETLAAVIHETQTDDFVLSEGKRYLTQFLGRSWLKWRANAFRQ